MNQHQFIEALNKQGITLTDKQSEQFELYYNILIEWNKKMNLTALTEKKEVYLKHFYDSISGAFFMDFTKKLHICDVGAGAGFPSIPLLICCPHLHLTIVDSLKKRTTFLKHLIHELSLDHVQIYHSRAEDFGQSDQFRERFDLVFARAVARMSVLSELCLPLVKQNGYFISWKGAKVNEEIDEAKKAINVLGGEIEEVHSFNLPVEKSERNIILVYKKRHTPKKYPRKAGTPNKFPII